MQKSTNFALYTRYEHGSLPVDVRLVGGRTEYWVGRPGVRFTSVKDLMTHLHGHEVPHMSFDRYFRLGKYAKGSVGTGGVLSLFGVDGDPGQDLRETGVVTDTFWEEYVERVNTRNTESFVGEFSAGLEGHIARVEGLFGEMDAWLEKKLEVGSKGIDLGARSERAGARYKACEVRKLLFAGFMGKMSSRGYDPEEVLQEVYRGLLVRNRGRCPFEEGKGSFGHYVHMVISCILTNYHRKQERRLDKDSVPLADEGDVGQWGICQLGYGTELRERGLQMDLERYLESWEDPQVEGARRVLPYVLAGCRRGELVAELGMNEQAVSRAVACLRRAVGSWALESGLEWGVPKKYLN